MYESDRCMRITEASDGGQSSRGVMLVMVAPAGRREGETA